MSLLVPSRAQFIWLAVACAITALLLLAPWDQEFRPHLVSARWLSPADVLRSATGGRLCYSAEHRPVVELASDVSDPLVLELTTADARIHVDMRRSDEGVYEAQAHGGLPHAEHVQASLRAGRREIARAELCWLESDAEIIARHGNDPDAWSRLRDAPEPYVRLRALVTASRAAFAQSKLDSSRALALKGARLALELGYVGEASRRFFSAAFVAFQNREFDDANAILAEAERSDTEVSNIEGLARNAYLRGSIAKQRAEYLLARDELRRAVELAARARLDSIVVAARTYSALVLAELGDFDAALATLAEAQPPPEASALARYQYKSNRATVLLQAHDAGWVGVDLDEIARLYDEALAVGDAHISEQEKANLRTRMAVVHLTASDTAKARRALSAVPLDEPARLGPVRWMAPLTAARLALAAGEFDEARRRLDGVATTLREAPHAVREVAPVQDALLGELLWRTGRVEEGTALMLEALRKMDALNLSRALPRARSVLYYRQRLLRQRVVRALVEQGDVLRAFGVAARARDALVERLRHQVRVDRDPIAWRAYVDARSRAGDRAAECEMLRADAQVDCRWEAAELRGRAEAHLGRLLANGGGLGAAERAPEDVRSRLSDGERLLAAFETPSGWLSFWVSPEAIAVESSEDPVEPWLDEITTAKHVYLLAGESRAVFDLPIRTTPRGRLGESVSVSILPAVSLLTPLREAPARPRLFVVGDADGTLPKALASANEIASRVDGARRALGPNATRMAVLDGLSTATHLHFEGHGLSSSDHVWDTKLQLAAGASLSVIDVIANQPALHGVVLSGCSTGKQSRRYEVGLPEGFILGGHGTVVLAATRTIEDGASARLLEDLYANGWLVDPREAWRRTVASAVERDDPTWMAFRLFGG